MSIVETSPTSAQPAIRGTNTDHGDGIWGQCDAGRGVVGVSSGGTGVWGHTVNGRGLVGVNNNEGTGVWGETDKGRGIVGIVRTDGDAVWGQCDAGRGVVGVSSGGTGVWGHTVNGRGLVGVNNNEGTGVWGETDKGRGVVGVSHQDVGVYGKGARAAGFFEGRVEITESLIVQHQDLLDEIKKLQKRVTDLEASVVTVAGVPTHVPIKRPHIAVTQTGTGPDGMRWFTMDGSDFRWPSFGNAELHILHENTGVSRIEFLDTLRFNFQERKLIGYFISEQCRAGERVSFSVKDTVGDSNDLTGALWSNNVTVICF
jgi:hypothetical protein